MVLIQLITFVSLQIYIIDRQGPVGVQTPNAKLPVLWTTPFSHEQSAWNCVVNIILKLFLKIRRLFSSSCFACRSSLSIVCVLSRTDNGPHLTNQQKPTPGFGGLVPFCLSLSRYLMTVQIELSLSSHPSIITRADLIIYVCMHA